MKKINLFICLFFSLLVGFTACSDNDDISGENFPFSLCDIFGSYTSGQAGDPQKINLIYINQTHQIKVSVLNNTQNYTEAFFSIDDLKVSKNTYLLQNESGSIEFVKKNVGGVNQLSCKVKVSKPQQGKNSFNFEGVKSGEAPANDTPLFCRYGIFAGKTYNGLALKIGTTESFKAKIKVTYLPAENKIMIKSSTHNDLASIKIKVSDFQFNNGQYHSPGNDVYFANDGESLGVNIAKNNSGEGFSFLGATFIED